MNGHVEALRYVEPERVEIAGDRCGGMTLKASTGGTFGRLQGFVVDPPARRVRYFVVRPSGSGPPQLIPITACRVNRDDRTIEVIDESGLRNREPFSPATFARFSDEDLLDALFHRPREKCA